MELITKFNHKYNIDPNVELTGKETEKKFYFPGPLEEGGRGGLQIRIIPEDSEEWIGIFSSTFSEGVGTSGIYSCPDEKTLCVVYAGSGYIGKVDSPQSWQDIHALPIKQVLLDPDSKVILFLDDTRIVAYNLEGKLWETRVSWDGIEVSGINQGFIFGKSYDPTYNGGTMVDFQVDLRTGQLEGGAVPK